MGIEFDYPRVILSDYPDIKDNTNRYQPIDIELMHFIVKKKYFIFQLMTLKNGRVTVMDVL